MAAIKPDFQDTYTASSDLSTKQYRFVKLSGDRRCTVCAAATDKPIGVLQDTPVAEGSGLVMNSGVTKVVAGGTLAAGDLVGTDANGAAVPVVPGTDTTKYITGHCLIGAASGAIAEILLDCKAPSRAA
jgi:hypothetical protein